MKIIVIQEHKGGDKELWVMEPLEINLEKQYEDGDTIGFYSRQITGITFTAKLQWSETYYLPRKRNIFKHVLNLCKWKKHGKNTHSK